MSVLVIIPARFASSRYPGKPLVELAGATGKKRSLIRRSWEAACQAKGAERVVVATDDDRIRVAAEAFGAEVVMTSSDCANGTERCAEVVDLIGRPHEVVVNFQGDAPLVPPWFVDAIVAGLRSDPKAAMATPVLRCDGRMLAGLLEDRRHGRVGATTAVFAPDGGALYFSKEVIPYRGAGYSDDEPTPVFHHVGLYAFRTDALRAYRGWPAGRLEGLEGLEQLRFLENGQRIACVEVDRRGRQFWELNNPQDVPILEQMMQEMGLE